MLSSVGVTLDEVPIGRRRFAFACLGWTERRAHLGGALGAALLDALLEQGWVARETGTRALRVTSKGRRELHRHLGITL